VSPRAGVDERHLFEERASGRRDDRAGLGKALAFIRAGDCLVVWKLDRLGPIPAASADHGDGPEGERDITFRSLTEQIDTTTPQGELRSTSSGACAVRTYSHGLLHRPQPKPFRF
jgi:DNA invertase Pin-like site-specific DNA recombinase